MNRIPPKSGINHIVWKYTLRRAGKPFYPDGSEFTLRAFQDELRSCVGKIVKGLELIRDYGLADRVRLGSHDLTLGSEFVSKKLAEYLYDNVIRPRFFAEAVHLIGSQAKALEPILAKVQLKRLERDNLATCLGNQIIQEAEIGRGFQLFSRQSRSKQLDILLRLGVIVLHEGCSLPVEEASASKTVASRPIVYEPRPPISQVRVTSTPEDPQLNFLNKLEGE